MPASCVQARSERSAGFLNHQVIIMEPSVTQFAYRAVLGLGRGGRPRSLAALGFSLALLGGCPGPSDGCGPLPRRKCSQAGTDSSTDAQYLVYNRETILTLVLKIHQI